MAIIGLKHIVAGKYNATEQGVVSHTEGMVLGKGIQADININAYDVKLYADDGIAEAEKGFQDGSLALQIDDLTPEAIKYTTGATEENATGVTGENTAKEIVSKSNDQAQALGVGFYMTKVKNGVRKYRAVFFPRVLFGSPNESATTKGETIAFQTPTINGTIMLAADGVWKREITFDTEDNAKKWVNAKVGISE